MIINFASRFWDWGQQGEKWNSLIGLPIDPSIDAKAKSMLTIIRKETKPFTHHFPSTTIQKNILHIFCETSTLSQAYIYKRFQLLEIVGRRCSAVVLFSRGIDLNWRDFDRPLSNLQKSKKFELIRKSYVIKNPSILVPRPRGLRGAERAMGTRTAVQLWEMEV